METKVELEKKIKELLKLKKELATSIEALILDHELHLLYTSYGKLVYEENNHQLNDTK